MKSTLQKLIKSTILFSLLLWLSNSFAQAPQKMSYQAVIRNASNTLVTNTTIGMKISVLQGTATGTAVYVETQTTTTNINGLATLEIGTGTVLNGSFATIAWGTNNYFIKTETDPAGGTNYTISGTSQFLSVPYALYSASGNTGATGSQGLTGATGAQGISGSSVWTTSGNNIANNNTGNVGIGTGATIPSSLLTVKKLGIGFTQEDPSATSKIGFYTNSTGAFLQTHSNTDLSFATNDGGTQMTLQKSTGNLGIGITTPTEKLEVLGKTKTTNLQVITGAGAGKVLTSDATGNATWQTDNSWQTTGNAGTNPASNFIGTTDDKDLIFKRNNIISGKIGVSNTSLGLNSTGSSTGSNNTSFGAFSQNQLSSSSSNTSVGTSALESNTGNENTAVGTRALQGNTINTNNVAVGFESLYFNSGGNSGTAIGSKSLRSNTSGDFNVAVGASALFANTDGYENTAIGAQAADNITTGGDNVAVGISALGTNQFGFFNTAIGAYAYNSGGLDNSTAIGYNSVITSSNQVRIGNAAITSIGGFADWTNVSDARFKKNIKQNVPGLEFIKKLRPVTYNLDLNSISKFNNTPEKLRDLKSEKLKESEIQTGFIAQEVEQAAKELNFEFSGVDVPKSDKDFYGLRYAEFVVPLAQAIQEQQNIITAQNQVIKSLEDRLKAIEVRLSR